MTKREAKRTELVSMQFSWVVKAIEAGDANRAYEATRRLWHEAVLLRRAQIAAQRTRLQARARREAYRMLGMVQTRDGSWE